MRDPSSRRSRRADGVPRSRTASSCGRRRSKSCRRAAPTTGRIRASPVAARRWRRVAYFTSNRGVDDVPSTSRAFTTARTTARSRTRSSPARHDADIIWMFDMMEEVGSFRTTCRTRRRSSTAICSSSARRTARTKATSTSRRRRRRRSSRSTRTTGKLVWEDNSVGDRILHGQWSTPAVGEIGGVVQVVHAQGDGWVRGYEALTGKKLWEFDTNPKDSVWPKTRNEVISTPVIYREHRLHRQRPGPGARRRRRPSLRDRRDQARRHHPDRARSGTSTRSAARSRPASIKDGLLFYSDFSGFLHCLDLKTGKPFWTHDMFAAIWGSPMVIDGKVYLGDEDGDVVVCRRQDEEGVAERTWAAPSTRRRCRPTARCSS